MEQIPKLIYIDDEEWAWCKNEQEYKPVSEFEPHANTRHGYHFHCRECWIEIMSNTSSQETRRKNENKMTSFILTKLGYDVKSDLSVHEQFLIRHNLI